MKDVRTYRSWSAMKTRCLNPNNPAYPRYGGRGITVCTSWLTYENFLADMGVRPAGKSIDRLNNDGNYEPGNCRWATFIEQNNNKRPERSRRFNWSSHKNVKLDEAQIREIRNSSATQRALATHYGVSASSIGDIKRGIRWNKVK